MYNEDFDSGMNGFSFMLVRDGVISQVSDQFIELTEYTFDELLNSKIEETFRTLRVGPDVDIENTDEQADYFLFTKSLEVKFVNIRIVDKSYQRIYIFQEKPDSRFEVKYTFANALCTDNYYGIGIYSMPDVTLLKANEKYIGYKDEPFNRRENCIGKHIWEFATGFKGSTYEDVWNTVIETGKPYNIDEYMYAGLKRGITYWKISLVPICEAGKIKYCIVMTTEITEQVKYRKRVEEQAVLIEHQKRELEAVLDNMNDGFSIIDKDCNYIRVNKKVKEWMRKPQINNIQDALEKIRYYDLNGKELTRLELPAIRVSKGERIEQYGIVMKSSKGDRYVSISGTPVYDDNGNFIMGVLNSRDMTETVKQSIVIKLQKEQLEAVIDNISEELYIVDKDRNYLMMNKAARERYSSYKFNNSNEYIEKNKLYDLSGKEIDFKNTPVARLSKGECIKDETIIVHDPDKRYVCTNAKPIFDENGNFVAGAMLCQDITTRVLQEQKIRYQNEQLYAVIDSMSDGLELVDNKMKITFLNQSAKDFFYNADAKVLAGDSLKYNKYYYGIDGKAIPREDLPAFRVLNKGSFQNYILTIERPDKKIYVSINGSIINNEDGTFEEAILSIRDITEQVAQEKAIEYHQEIALQAEREKREALEKAIEMKDEFLSLISHEFRTPLNVISTAIQAINYICGKELSDRLKGYLNIIRQNTFRQLRLVNNLLDITRADAGRIRVNKTNRDMVFLTDSIVKSVSTYSSQKGVNVTFMPSVEKIIIGIDDEKYERILLNLLSNAIKFTPEGKSITVKLRTVGKSISIEVKDTGIGIPKDKLNVIFERFGQVDSSLSRQAEGAGIGLSLVKRLVEALDGSISVKSSVGKGSSFTIMLPNERVLEEPDLDTEADLLDNRLVQATTVEFSDIYL